MKRTVLSIWSLLLAAVILAGAVFMTTSCKKEAEKELTVTEYLEKVMEKTADVRVTGPIGKTRDTIGEGAVRFDLSFKPTDDLTLLLGRGGALPALSLSGVKSGDLMRVSLSAATDGKTVDGTFTSNGSAVAVESSFFDKVYGTDLKNFEENYKSSIFADENGKYGAGSGRDVLEGLEAFSSVTDLTDLLRPYVDAVKDALDTDYTTMEKPEEGGRKITVSLDNDKTKAIVKTLAGKAKEDADLRALLDKLVDAFGSEDDRGKVDGFYEAEDPGKKVDEFFEENVTSTFSFTEVIVTDAEDLLSRVDITLEITDDEGEKHTASLVCDMSGADKSTLSLALEGDWGEEIPFKKASIVRCVAEDSETAYRSYISVAVESDKMNVEARVFDFSYDCTTHAYEASVNIPQGETYTLKGELFLEENAVELTVASLEIGSLKQLFALRGGDGSIALDLRLRAAKTEETVTMPEYTEFFSLTEEEMDKLAQKLRSFDFGNLPLDTLPL